MRNPHLRCFEHGSNSNGERRLDNNAAGITKP